MNVFVDMRFLIDLAGQSGTFLIACPNLIHVRVAMAIHNGKHASKCTSDVFNTTNLYRDVLSPTTTPWCSLFLSRAITQYSSISQSEDAPDVLWRNKIRRIACECSSTSKNESKVTFARSACASYSLCKSARTNFLSHISPIHCRSESMRQLFCSPSESLPGLPYWT